MEQPNLQIGSSYPALQKIFQLEVGQITEPIETPNGYQIVRMKEKKDGYIPQYEETKDKVVEAWKMSEAKKLAKQKAEKDLAAVKEAFKDVRRPDFAQTAKNLKLEIQQTPVFGRGEYLPNIGISKDFQDIAFSLTTEDRLAKKIAETEKGFCILHLDSTIPAEKVEFNKDRDKLTDNLLTQRKAEKFNEFLTQLRAEAKIVDNISNLRKQNQ